MATENQAVTGRGSRRAWHTISQRHQQHAGGEQATAEHARQAARMAGIERLVEGIASVPSSLIARHTRPWVRPMIHIEAI